MHTYVHLYTGARIQHDHEGALINHAHAYPYTHTHTYTQVWENQPACEGPLIKHAHPYPCTHTNTYTGVRNPACARRGTNQLRRVAEHVRIRLHSGRVALPNGMYVCMYVCMYVYMPCMICISSTQVSSVCAHMCVCVYLLSSVLCVRTCVCVCLSSLQIPECMHTRHVCMYPCMYVCMYVLYGVHDECMHARHVYALYTGATLLIEGHT